MSFTPTVFEIAGKYLSLYEGFYKEVDPHFKGIISANEAAAFLKRSNLSNALLGRIWEIADQNRKGYLDKVGFFVALKLLACVQQGLEPVSSNLTLDIPAPAIAGQADSPSVPMFGGQQEAVEWIIKPKDRIKYDEIFDTLGPVNGKLVGDQVKPVLLNSGLPTELLGKIWELSDIDKDGFLDREEMSVALHLVYRALENDPIPAVLPTAMVPPSKRSVLGRRSTLTGAVAVLPPHPHHLTQKARASSVTSMESVGLVGGPQSPTSATRSLSGTPIPTTIVKPPAPWIVDKTKWERSFTELDKDRDGLVNGNDVKDIFLLSGLSQMYLAHIWNLCDINSSGRLNLEQFALAMHFVDLKKVHNLEPPAALPPDLIPPSFRPSPAGMTDMATNTSLETNSELPKSSGNKEIDQISKEIADLQNERREFEQQIVQLEADMTIKHSEIRNLEVELNTLESTLGQLERQKGEAQKRLDDLENQRTNIRNSLNELKRKNDEELGEVKMLRAEVENSTATMKNNEDVLNEKRLELQKLRDEEGRLEVKLRMQKGNLQDVVQRDASIEENVHKAETAVQQLREQRARLMEKLTKLEEIIRTGDVNILETDADLLTMNDIPLVDSANLDDLSINSNVKNTAHRNQYDYRQFGAVSHPTQSFGATFDDPFSSHDPFANAVDPFANADPFGASGGDPFANSTGFGGMDMFAPSQHSYPVVDDVWSNNKPPSPPKMVAGVKKPPPRPAPPKNRPVTPKDPAMSSDPFSAAPSDPFSGMGAASTPVGGFANFADFSKFS